MGSIIKVMNVEVKNVSWRFCPFLHLESSDGVSEKLQPISTLSYSRTGCCSPYTFYALSHSLSKCWHAFCHARGWQTNDISHTSFYTGLLKWRENGVKIMAPRWRLNPTSLLQELDRCRFEPKRQFWSAFQFPGTRNKWMYYSKFLYPKKITCCHKKLHNSKPVRIIVLIVNTCHIFEKLMNSALKKKKKNQVWHNHEILPYYTNWHSKQIGLRHLKDRFKYVRPVKG